MAHESDGICGVSTYDTVTANIHRAHIMSTRGAHYVGLMCFGTRGGWQATWIKVEEWMEAGGAGGVSMYNMATAHARGPHNEHS
jgi:hypothetical protein